MDMPLNVVIGCEQSGVVRDAFIRHGHNAISVDLEPSESDFGPHHQGDVLEFLDAHEGEFDLGIFHPPCTYLTFAGVQWLYQPHSYEIDGERWEKMEAAAAFFNQFRGRAPMVAIENPPHHNYARKIIGTYTQVIQPYQFGEPWSKRTALWLENLPKLVPTNVLTEYKPYAKDRWPGWKGNRRRALSRTFDGIADAMAAQWGTYGVRYMKEHTV